MNLVGVKGEGESVWLGWFLAYTLGKFIPIAEARKDKKRADIWKAHLESLTKALDRDGWDGQWYRRGFYDNGAPLGSKDSDECQIDAIAQSWSVLSGVADPKRAEQAMVSLEKYLLDDEGELLRLFTPPSTGPSRSRATSRAIRRVFARMAGSTPMVRPGPSWRSPAWARRRKHGACSR